MTNWTMTREMTEEERAGELPCFVQHEDAGGRCGRPATMKVYGLNYCREHGAEVSQGASMGERREVAEFFERMRSPYVPAFSDAVDGEIDALVSRYNVDAHDDSAYRDALLTAYPETTEKVRQEIDSWKRDEAPGPATVEDLLLDSLTTLHRCMSVAYRRGEAWLVENLDETRQADAVRCAYAMKSEESGARLHSV